MRLETLNEARYVGERSKQVFINKFLDIDIEEPEGIQYTIKDDFIMKIQNRDHPKEFVEKLYFYTDESFIVVDFADHIHKSQNHREEYFFKNIEVFRTKREF